MATFEIIGASSGGGGSPAGYAAGYPDGTKIYMALLTQSGTDAPVATVLMNTLGGTVVWSYDGTGSYFATLNGVFLSGKVACFVTPPLNDASVPLPCIFQCGRLNNNVVNLLSYIVDGSVSLQNTWGGELSIQILVFP